MYVCANILKDQCRAQQGHSVRFPKDTSKLETGQLRAIVETPSERAVWGGYFSSAVQNGACRVLLGGAAGEVLYVGKMVSWTESNP